jgi:hypothetical protein
MTGADEPRLRMSELAFVSGLRISHKALEVRTRQSA